MSVGRICRRVVHVATPGETAMTVARRMREHNVGTVVVLDQRRRPIGILTDRDLVMRVMATDLDATETHVATVMTGVPTLVRESTPIETALGVMRSGSFRRLPVVDDDRSLVGVVSLDDVLELIAEEVGLVGGILAAEAPRD